MASRKIYTLSIFLVIGVLFFAFLGIRPLANPDEGRYAEIAREMNATGNWIIPRLNGVLYFEKPPLIYWINAASQKLGKSLFFCRFLNTCLAFTTCLILYFFGKRLNFATGLWSALIYASSTLGFGMSQMMTVDTGVTIFITASLLFFLEIFLRTEKSPWLFAGAFLSIGLAVMAKGLIGFVFPALIVLPWMFFSKNFTILKNKWFWISLIAMVLLITPWHFAVSLRHPEFFKFYFWHEHFERYLTSAHNRSKALCFMPLSFLIGLAPWVLFLPRALWHLKSETNVICKKRLYFMVLWMTSVVLFFTFSKSQLIPYVLPAIPPAAILIGYFLSQIDKSKLKIEIGVMAFVYLIGAFVIPFVATKKAVNLIPMWVFMCFCIPLALGGITMLCWLKKTHEAFKLFVVIPILLFFFSPLAMPYFQRLNTQAFAQFILKYQKSPSEIFCVYDYFQDLPFYLKRTVGIIDHVPDEQSLGTRLEPCPRYISSAMLKTRWPSDTQIYVLVRSRDENKFNQSLNPLTLCELMRDKHFVLFSNQPCNNESK